MWQDHLHPILIEDLRNDLLSTPSISHWWLMRSHSKSSSLSVRYFGGPLAVLCQLARDVKLLSSSPNCLLFKPDSIYCPSYSLSGLLLQLACMLTRCKWIMHSFKEVSHSSLNYASHTFLKRFKVLHVPLHSVNEYCSDLLYTTFGAKYTRKIAHVCTFCKWVFSKSTLHHIWGKVHAQISKFLSNACTHCRL